MRRSKKNMIRSKIRRKMSSTFFFARRLFLRLSKTFSSLELWHIFFFFYSVTNTETWTRTYSDFGWRASTEVPKSLISRGRFFFCKKASSKNHVFLQVIKIIVKPISSDNNNSCPFARNFLIAMCVCVCCVSVDEKKNLGLKPSRTSEISFRRQQLNNNTRVYIKVLPTDETKNF